MSGQNRSFSFASLSECCASPLPESSPSPDKETEVSAPGESRNQIESCSAGETEDFSSVEGIEVQGEFSDKIESSSAGETDYSSSSEGIEVEAVEFNQSKDNGLRFHFPRRFLLLIVAFLLIVTSSAVAGFWILSGKKASSSALALSSGDFDIDAEVAEVLNVVTNNNDNTEGSMPIDVDEDEVTNFEDTILRNTSKPTSSPSVSQTFAASSTPSVTSTDGASQEFSTTVSSRGTPAWNDSPCPDHDLAVSSSCATNSTDSLSKASFCFASKRDGDWYWIRNSVAENRTMAIYDSWDYTEESKGELTFLDLSEGNYIISLVRDSMKPYDEIISHEFIVPECE